MRGASGLDRARVFVTRPIPDTLLRRLAEHADLTVRQGELPPTARELAEQARGHDAVVCMLTDPFDATVLDALASGGERRLRLLSQVAVGLDNIDLPAADRLGVGVRNTPSVLTDATADLTMALLLATVRHLPSARRAIDEGRWTTWRLDAFCGLELRGATLSILGFGRIGAAVAQRAAAFGMRVIAHTRSPVPKDSLVGLNVEFVEFARLLREADVLTLHLPLQPETRHRIGGAELAALRRGAYLVNTARGALVVEQALVDALDSGHLAGAGLDVFEDEPRIHPALLERDDVVLTPHIGSATHRCRHRMAELAVDQVIRWIELGR